MEDTRHMCWYPRRGFSSPIGDFDPVTAAPLTDAGITTYSAIKPALPWDLARQHRSRHRHRRVGTLRNSIPPAVDGHSVVAVDSTEARRKLALEYGADNVVSLGPDAAHQIRELLCAESARLRPGLCRE